MVAFIATHAVGDAYDNALAQTEIGLFKAELIRRRDRGAISGDVELETLEWVDGFNHRRLHSACADPWWEATRARRLVLQTCQRCGHRQHYPRAVCTACGSGDLGWTQASGAGTVVSHTTVHRSPSPRFAAPYVLALVRLAEGPQLLTTIDGQVRCDAPVVLDWRPLTDGRHLPVFRPDAES